MWFEVVGCDVYWICVVDFISVDIIFVVVVVLLLVVFYFVILDVVFVMGMDLDVLEILLKVIKII